MIVVYDHFRSPIKIWSWQRIYGKDPDEGSNLVKQIGEGAYGVVFIGSWRGIDVAVKKLNSNQLDEKAVEEFHHEARVMGKMGNHPNICGFIGAVTGEERYDVSYKILS